MSNKLGTYAYVMSNAPLDIYNSINNENDIHQLMDEQRAEGLYIEYKSKTNRATPKLDDSDKKNFSKVVSGFANAEGGVLLWGIKSKTTTNGIDTPHELMPIVDPSNFCMRLRSSLTETTQPPVDGIQMDIISSDKVLNNSPTGYIKCLIPASDRPPHRAEQSGLYYRRTSLGQRQMEHYELEDIFGRRLRPRLKAVVKLTPTKVDDPRHEISFHFVNEGKGIAKHS